MRTFLLLAAVLIATAAAPTSSASADAIRMRQCSSGWENRRIGHGAFCFPVVCADDAACPSGSTCREVGRCWTHQMRPRGRRQLDPDDPNSWVWVASDRSECTDTCSGEAECRQARECVPGAAPVAAEPTPETPAQPAPAETAPAETAPAETAPAEQPPAESDSSCRIGHGGPLSSGFVLLALAGLWLHRRS